MLYLPPRYAHDGVAVEAEQGEPTAPCMTYSIGFRAPHEAELVSGLLERLAEVVADEAEGLPARFYRDPGQQATDTPAKLPEDLLQFARTALERALSPELLASVLGEYLSEPKPSVWFEANEQELTWPPASGLSLHARSRMLYDQTQVFINGESFLARGADARLMHRLADQRGLSAGECRKASPQAREVLAQWLEQGWLTVNAEE
jgi:50S ribosomal protein L16 3-hydroxylase